MSDKPKLPKRFIQFTENYPEVADAYSKLGYEVHNSGPLNDKTRALIKIAISGGARIEGAFHAHVRKARLLDISWEEIEHVALLAMPTIGFPTSIALLSWINDEKEKS